jgi:hypothetical protein
MTIRIHLWLHPFNDYDYGMIEDNDWNDYCYILW